MTPNSEPLNVISGIRKVVAAIGLLLGTLSVIRLIALGFKVSLAAVAEAILSSYEDAVTYLAEFVQPQIYYLLHHLGLYFPLQPHWKHIFILLMIYCGTRARIVGRLRANGTAVFLWVTGFAISLAASIWAGYVVLGRGENSAQSNILVFSIALFGIVLFELLGSAWASFWWRYNSSDSWAKTYLRNIPADLRFLLWGGIAVALELLAKHIPFLGELSNPGLAMLFVLMLGVSVYWIACQFVSRGRRDVVESWWQAFRRKNNAKFGAAIVIVFAGATLFFFLNAGLTKLGY